MAEAHNQEDDPIYSAIKYKLIKRISILLPKMKHINKNYGKGYTLLLLACEQSDNEEVLDLLLARKDIDVAASTEDGFTAVHILAFNGNLKGLMKVLQVFPEADINAVSKKGNTPLIEAVKKNHLPVVQYLIEKGAHVNHQNHNKRCSALHYAATFGYTQCAELLLEQGADIHATNGYGFTPLIKASSWGFTELCKVLLRHGAEVNYDVSETETANELAADAGHIYRRGATALLSACYKEYIETCELLLKNGADVNHVSARGRTPLTIACEEDQVEVLKLLISYGADFNFPGPYSKPLMVCAKNGSTRCAEELLKAGVHATGRVPTGETALDFAVEKNHYDIVRLLSPKNL